MLTLCVSMSLSSKDIGGRIQISALKVGIRSAKELFERMMASGYEVKLGGIRRHWECRLVPSTPYVASYSDFLKVSANWLLTGKEPPPPSITQLKEIVGKMIQDAGGTTSKDATLTEIDLLLARIDPAKREAILQFLRSMTPESM
jgi:hypothetical protein